MSDHNKEPIQGHTIRIEKQENNDFLVKCLSCSYEETLPNEISAYQAKGYHFGRFSTTIWPFGSFSFESK